MGKQVEAIRKCYNSILKSKGRAIGCGMTGKDYAELWEEAKTEKWVKRTRGWQVAKYKAKNCTEPDGEYFMDDVDMLWVIQAADGDKEKVVKGHAEYWARFMATPICDC